MYNTNFRRINTNKKFLQLIEIIGSIHKSTYPYKMVKCVNYMICTHMTHAQCGSLKIYVSIDGSRHGKDWNQVGYKIRFVVSTFLMKAIHGKYDSLPSKDSYAKHSEDYFGPTQWTMADLIKTKTNLSGPLQHCHMLCEIILACDRCKVLRTRTRNINCIEFGWKKFNNDNGIVIKGNKKI